MSNGMTVKCGSDLLLRDLTIDDYDKILEIVHACAACSTRKLYNAYKLDHNLIYNMNSIFEKDFLVKLRGNFKHFDDILAREKIDDVKSPQFKDFLNKIETAFKLYPDDHLFLPYGPIQSPYEDSVKEFLELAIDTSTVKDRKIYRMGIVIQNELAGCFTIDFKKNKILGYPNETTGDPGIFITPHCRENNKIRRWQEVFSLAAAIVKKYYPFNDQEIPISATTHQINQETGNILSKFTEYTGAVLHGSYGARRFFTISRDDFINNYQLAGIEYQAIIE